MKSKSILFMMALLVSSTLLGQNHFEQKHLTGSWLGILKVQGIQLRLVFNLTQDESGKLIATMDSPDQGANGIAMGDVSFEVGKLKIDAPAIRGFYEGTMILVDSMNGSWNQNGQTFDLPIKKQKEEFSVKRPQEPKPPFAYAVEAVKFKNENAGHTLAGTLTIPKEGSQFPAVILISGSGAQDRNEEIFGHKPFMVIADYLTRHGIAVLRYDDQGIDQSEGSQLNTTSFDYSFDAEAAFKYLQTDERINSKAIGFAGHSEGGLIAPIVIARNSKIGFFISLAGPAMIGTELLLLQTQALAITGGINQNEIEESQQLNAAIFKIIIDEQDNEEAFKMTSDFYKNSLEKNGKNTEEVAKDIKTFEQSFPLTVYTWMRYFLKTDPADFLLKVACPVLVLNGDKDLQVLSKENLIAYEKIFKKSGLEDFELKAMQNHNHLFQHCTTGLPAEYGNIEETFSEEVLDLMEKWINKRFSTR